MKPILFNTEMVRAILEGRKTVSRRVVKLPKRVQKQENGLYTLFTEGTVYENFCIEQIVDYISPYQVGDILYVRETWSECEGIYIYRAGTKGLDAIPLVKWKPSIHMPKEIARIFLRVTDVRVERLQDITREQVHKEGVPSRIAGENTVMLKVETETGEEIVQNGIEMCHVDFATLWNSTIKRDQLDTYDWNANPYVWVIEFERVEKPAAD